MPGGMKLEKLTVGDIPSWSGKRVLVRVDYNVPLEGGRVADNTRIVATIPTIRHLLDKHAKTVILMSHLGRPDGVVDEKLSLKPVAIELEKLIGQPVKFLSDCVGSKVEEACQETEGIVLLENLRFHIEEEGVVKRGGTKISATFDQIAAFRSSLSRLGDIYVNDAFGAAHRAHSSIVGIEVTPKVAGLLLAKELQYFDQVLNDGIELAILGGSKVSDKIQLISNLLPKVKTLAISGAMAFTFVRTLNSMEIGKSLFDEPGAKLVPGIMEQAKKLGVEILLPTDFVTGSDLSVDARVGSATVKSGIPTDMMGLDIGPSSTEDLINAIGKSRSILWNGPVGVFEIEPFSHGTQKVIKALVTATKQGATTIVGGGDSGAAVAKFHAEGLLSHVSTGGGASLELLEGKVLPGISALTEKQ
jgi:phosphoglycerate kinase